ncbi:3-hydroxy-3-methylglutaryl-coenzyme A (HMG-CoA) reductase isozyme [Aphanomyces cochlioides]|nr:3-hydroxy-3-methylglutaryl-coenzyme A (HMG-CoA) reductase isozyme [Aphanomyces cochlioides]
MMVIVLAALVVSSESVRSVLEETFAWFVQLLVDNTQEFFWGLMLLTCFCLLSYIMEPEKTKRTRPTAATNKPRWEVFRVTNYIVSAMFVVSLSLLLSHQNKREQQQHLMVFYIAACGCILSLTYFFAFFAVGFASNQVHDESSEDEKEDDKWKSTSPKACQPPFEKEKVKMVIDGDDAAILKQLTAKDPATGRPLMALHELEKKLQDYERAVRLRRLYFEQQDQLDFSQLPVEGYDYGKVYGSNCEVVVGYVPLPVGLAGPIKVNGENVYLPMATTEGCLIASTNRGCKVLNMGGGVDSIVLADSITRAPCVRFARAVDAAALKAYLDNKDNFEELAAEFNSTTRYGRMTAIKTVQSGRNCYVRIACNAGNAMGMNMVSKGTLAVLTFLKAKFPLMELVALSGNVCTDKKSAAINWLEGRGKSVVADAVVKADIVTKVLRTSVDALVDLNIQKNLIGSAMAGSLGGFNAQAANILTAIFLATGQDPAQNVESSSCMTTMEKTADGDLYISVTMPSIEVGTVGGGTHLAPQKSCLGLMGCAPDQTHKEVSESGSRRLACAIAAGVMAGELSLLAALATNELVKSHMDLNRKK